MEGRITRDKIKRNVGTHSDGLCVSVAKPQYDCHKGENDVLFHENCSILVELVD
jgi:hypothetical protein